MLRGALSWRSIRRVPERQRGFDGAASQSVQADFKLALAHCRARGEQMLAGIGEETFANVTELGHTGLHYLIDLGPGP